MTAKPTPDREQLQAILQKGSGTLEETPYPLLLLAMAAAEKSGAVQLRRNQLEKTIVFDCGSPVDCLSNIATEMLGRFLISSGRIAEADAHAAFSTATARGVPLGEVLMERKLLTSTELYRALQQNLGRKLLEPFSWKSGTYSISEDARPLASVLKVKVPQLLVTGILKVEPQESADEAVATFQGMYLTISPEPIFGFDEFRLSPKQQKVVDEARKGAKIEDIRSATGMDADDLNRLVYALMLLGVFTFSDQPAPYMPKWEKTEPEEDEVPVVVVLDEEKPAPAPAAFDFLAAAPLSGTPPATPDEVMAAYLSCRRKDAFDLLGIDESATGASIIQAFLKMADQFLPSKFGEGSTDGLGEKAQEVFLAAARAYAELADPDRRQALVDKRAKLREEAAAAAQAGPAAMIDPEALCESGRRLAAAGKIREALSSFELAAECDAQNGTYAAEAAWCRFQLKITPPANALKLLKNAIRIDPNAGVAYLYTGQVLAAIGSTVEAAGYLGRAATLLPDDPRPALAQRAVR
ncbi:MAG TPA: DUF4388 domain-containing protein [Thermoanaerobaculia bacterium]|nr:DUF4388 domain-containing protein [Thermoanaerobaculia bacterium]